MNNSHQSLTIHQVANGWIVRREAPPNTHPAPDTLVATTPDALAEIIRLWATTEVELLARVPLLDPDGKGIAQAFARATTVF